MTPLILIHTCYFSCHLSFSFTPVISHDTSHSPIHLFFLMTPLNLLHTCYFLWHLSFSYSLVISHDTSHSPIHLLFLMTHLILLHTCYFSWHLSFSYTPVSSLFVFYPPTHLFLLMTSLSYLHTCFFSFLHREGGLSEKEQKWTLLRDDRIRNPCEGKSEMTDLETDEKMNNRWHKIYECERSDDRRRHRWRMNG